MIPSLRTPRHRSINLTQRGSRTRGPRHGLLDTVRGTSVARIGKRLIWDVAICPNFSGFGFRSGDRRRGIRLRFRGPALSDRRRANPSSASVRVRRRGSTGGPRPAGARPPGRRTCRRPAAGRSRPGSGRSRRPPLRPPYGGEVGLNLSAAMLNERKCRVAWPRPRPARRQGRNRSALPRRAHVFRNCRKTVGSVSEPTPGDRRRPVAGQDVKLADGVRPQVDFRALDAGMAEP